MLGIMAVVLDSMMLCCAAYCGERYDVQHVEFSDMMHVQHDDVLVGMLGVMAVVLGSIMLCFAACCGERYVLQQVVFSGMVEVGQNDTFVGMLGIMLRWAA